MTAREQILKSLFQKVNDKAGATDAVGKAVGASFYTVKRWLSDSGQWRIPEAKNEKATKTLLSFYRAQVKRDTKALESIEVKYKEVGTEKV